MPAIGCHVHNSQLLRSSFTKSSTHLSLSLFPRLEDQPGCWRRSYCHDFHGYKTQVFPLRQKDPSIGMHKTIQTVKNVFFLSISLLDCIYAKELKSSKTPQQIWSSPDGHQQGGAFRIVQVSRIQLMWRLYLYYQINQIVINLNIHKWKLICWSGKTPGWLVCTSMLEVKYIFSTICEVKQNLGGASREVRWRV